MSAPIDLLIGPDCNLYVAHYGVISRFDTSTGNQAAPFPSSTGMPGTAQFVAQGAGDLGQPGGLTFGPDGHLYVSDQGTNMVLRYDGETGAFLERFVGSGSGGLSRPTALTFGPAGDLFVASYDNDAIMRYDGITGEPKPSIEGGSTAEFVLSGAGGLDGPSDFLFRNGDLFVASEMGGTACGPHPCGQLIEYSGTYGDLIRVLTSSVVAPSGLTLDRYGWIILTTSMDDFFIQQFGVLLGDNRGHFGHTQAGTIGNSDLIFLPDSCFQPSAVPNGAFGRPMTIERLNPFGEVLRISWDVRTCPSADYNLLYGTLDSVEDYELEGAECDADASGVHTWFGVPAGNLWFIVVGNASVTDTEGSWGQDSDGNERGVVSGFCGITSRDEMGTGCP